MDNTIYNMEISPKIKPQRPMYMSSKMYTTYLCTYSVYRCTLHRETVNNKSEILKTLYSCIEPGHSKYPPSGDVV